MVFPPRCPRCAETTRQAGPRFRARTSRWLPLNKICRNAILNPAFYCWRQLNGCAVAARPDVHRNPERSGRSRQAALRGPPHSFHSRNAPRNRDVDNSATAPNVVAVRSAAVVVCFPPHRRAGGIGPMRTWPKLRNVRPRKAQKSECRRRIPAPAYVVTLRARRNTTRANSCAY